MPLLLLFLAIPIPLWSLTKCFPLRSLLAVRGVVHEALWHLSLRTGNVIELLRAVLETKKLEVVEACSGIRSLMTLVTLSVVFAFITFRRSRRGIVQPLSAD